MNQFFSLTVFVLAFNESEILRQTVDGIRKNCPDEDLDRIVIVCKNSTCPAYHEASDTTIKRLKYTFRSCESCTIQQ